MTLAVILIVGAAILGTLANIVWGPAIKRHQDKRGVSEFLTQTHVGNNYGPAATLLALLIAFVLAGATQSFSRAKTAVQTEASLVDNLFETAEYLEEPERERMQHATLCYARAVAGPEWKSMESGQSSDVPRNWTGTRNNGIRSTLQALGPDASLFSTLISADQKRGDARRTRLTESNPTIPPILIAFMLGVMGTMIVFLALASPRLSPFHIAATVISAATLLCAVGLIRTLDRPFGGAIKIEPTQMRITADDVTEDFTERYGTARIGCDDDGNPTKSS